jgi:tRNA A-37 threonylcarbamoyl transferase component Bud32
MDGCKFNFRLVLIIATILVVISGANGRLYGLEAIAELRPNFDSQPISNFSGSTFGINFVTTNNGTRLCVGNPDYSGGVGLAHVFDFAGNEWTQFRQVDGVTNWDASVAGKTPKFGTSVDCTDQTLIAGGFSFSLSLYTYIFTSFPGFPYEPDKALGIGFTGFQFGFVVKLTPDGNTAVIAIPRAVYSEGSTGAILTFNLQTQAQQQIRPPDLKSSNDNKLMGVSLDLFKDHTIVAGAPGDNGNAGAVYVFQNDGTGQFQYKQKIIPPSSFVAAQYGLVISISRDGLTIAVGLPNLGENGVVDLLSRPTINDLFTRQVTFLYGGFISENNAFGLAVKLDYDLLLVGAPAFPGGDSPTNTGAAFLFNISSAYEVPPLVGAYLTDNTEENLNMQYGTAVDIVNEHVIIAAPGRRVNGTQVGSIFSYKFSETCGNGVLDPDEECDYHYAPNSTAIPCSPFCKCIAGYLPLNDTAGNCYALCGDSFVAPYEECELGGEGCTKTCTCAPGWTSVGERDCKTLCGNNVLDSPEQCEYNSTLSSRCNQDCTCERGYYPSNSSIYTCVPECGDTIKVDEEQCEKNAADAQFCDQSCACNEGTTTKNSTTSFCEFVSNIISDPPQQDVDEGSAPINIIVPIVVCGAAAIAGAVILAVLMARRNKKLRHKRKMNINLNDLDKGDYKPMPYEISSMTLDEKLQIPYKGLKLVKEIGSGAFGKVFIAEWQATQVAIKVSNIASDEDFKREAELMIKLRPHPNVVRFLGISTDGPFAVIILEYCNGGSLDKILFDNKNDVSYRQQLDWARGIARGLLHLHSNQVAHRDLAARNILLSGKVPKISDFGMSRKLEATNQQSASGVGPVCWMAPESIQSRNYSTMTDIWTFGVVLYEIVARQAPYEGENIMEVALQIRDSGLHPTIPKECPPLFREIMERCWNLDPTLRPTASDICQILDTEAEGLTTPTATSDTNTTTSGGSIVVTTSNVTFGTSSATSLIPQHNDIEQNNSGSESSS